MFTLEIFLGAVIPPALLSAPCGGRVALCDDPDGDGSWLWSCPCWFGTPSWALRELSEIPAQHRLHLLQPCHAPAIPSLSFSNPKSSFGFSNDFAFTHHHCNEYLLCSHFTAWCKSWRNPTPGVSALHEPWDDITSA